MGDHLFEAPVLRRMLELQVADGDSILAVDSSPPTPPWRTRPRVRLSGGRITAIGKDVDPWDALDTGLFVFSPRLFDALEESRASGQTTLSAGVQRLAARGCARPRCRRRVLVRRRHPRDLDAAETLLAAEPEPA